MSEPRSAIVIPIAGQDVRQCRVGYGFSLVFPDTTIIKLGNDFRLTDAEGSVTVVPARQEGVCRALSLFAKEVEEAVARPDGHLILRFTEGSMIDAPPLERFEAWEIARDDGFKLVCLGDGEYAIWDPRPPKA